MSTLTRPELSQNNKYWIPKERYYELKHFCRQYPDWKKVLKMQDIWPKNASLHEIEDTPNDTRIVEECCIRLEKAATDVEIVESAARATDEFLTDYILKSVTENYSCDYLILHGMPCGRDKFYSLYRKFFWILDKTRN